MSKQKQPTQGSSNNLLPSKGGATANNYNSANELITVKPLAASSSEQQQEQQQPLSNGATVKTANHKRSQPVYKMRILRTSSHTIHELDKAKQKQ